MNKDQEQSNNTNIYIWLLPISTLVAILVSFEEPRLIGAIWFGIPLLAMIILPPTKSRLWRPVASLATIFVFLGTILLYMR
ncbi:MAG: hypothetical protein AAGF95_31925 [Chloroflexota bacterium]